MDLLLIAALILLGSILESAFAFFFAKKTPQPDATMDDVTKDRYSRLQSDFETA